MCRVKYCIVIIFLVPLAACGGSSHPKIAANPSIESSDYGTVVDVSEAHLESSANYGDRIFSRFSIPGPILWAKGNEDHYYGRPNNFFYKIEMISGEVLSLYSFSIVDRGACVSVIQTEEKDLYILRKMDANMC